MKTTKMKLTVRLRGVFKLLAFLAFALSVAGGLVFQTLQSWAAKELQRLRNYQHLSRAYQFEKQGWDSAAKVEFQSYLKGQEEDSTARLAYLNLLSKMRDYPGVIAQAEPAQFEPQHRSEVLFQRGVALQMLAKSKRHSLIWMASRPTRRRTATNGSSPSRPSPTPRSLTVGIGMRCWPWNG